MLQQTSLPSIDQRIVGVDWDDIHATLDRQGWAVVPGLLGGAECEAIAALYGPSDRFHSHVVMARHGFGQGEYRYFSYPLPPLVEQMRSALYPRLVPIANCWHERMGIEVRFPAEHAAFLDRCHSAGQTRPTPLLLQYGQGDYNCLHQDLYGEHVFPLQVAVQLSEPAGEYTWGEFIITEQRPRMQSRASVVPLGKGDAVIFAVNSRPHRGARGDFRVKLRHGVGTVRSGRRHTLGIILHDAR